MKPFQECVIYTAVIWGENELLNYFSSQGLSEKERKRKHSLQNQKTTLSSNEVKLPYQFLLAKWNQGCFEQAYSYYRIKQT